jgi:exodeoxyribonuclease VII large subunit
MNIEKNLGKKNCVLSVSELNFSIKQLLENSVPLLWVRGEISNLLKAASGHFYFSLKDDCAQVRCAMFRHKSQFVERPLMNGQMVEVLALATLYEQRGEFQLTVEQVRLAGLGTLHERFEQLKKSLESEGLFSGSRKRRLPLLPKQIGIITSPQAAALQDTLATLKARMPGVPVVLYPTPVQGAGSGEKIAQTVRLANWRAECDVLIVCRGGGSIEDLWAFNEEGVARAIATSAIPVVTGVGHETDFTIADFVADERAPTPTGAAQRVVPDRHELLKNLRDQAQHLRRTYHNRLLNAAQSLDYAQRGLIQPTQRLQIQEQQLTQLQERMRRAFIHRKQQQQVRWQSLVQRLVTASGNLAYAQAQQVHLTQRFSKAIHDMRTRWSARLDNNGQQLALLNPKRVLERGYSLVRDISGNVVSDADQLVIGGELEITFASGKAKVGVKEKQASR